MPPPPATAERDRLLCEAARLHGLTAAVLAALMAIYHADGWLRDRAAPECPARLVGQALEWIWRALKAYPRLVGEAQLEEILRADRRRQAAAERTRRWRARQRADVAMVAVPVDFAMLDRLIDRGLLGEADSEDKAAVAAAIAAALR